MSSKAVDSFLEPHERYARRRYLSVSTLLAWRNLAHERLRLIVTIIGIVFAVVLMSVLVSLLLGFTATTAGLIEHTDADLWICGRGTKNIDQAANIPSRWRFKALENPDVIAAENYIVRVALLRRPDGGSETIMFVGLHVHSGLGAPWNIIEGSAEDLKRPDAIFVDVLYREKLGITQIGQSIEINGRRARVLGFTQGIRTFVQAPYVFAAFKTAQQLGVIEKDATTYLLAKLRPGAHQASAKQWLQERMPAAAVFDRAEFARATQVYWLFATGAGTALIFAAVLGLVIGGVITAQTLYASAMDHLPEYATIRAMGAPKGYLNGIIIKQALMTAVIGYGIGISFSLTLVHLAHNSNTAMLLPWQVVIGLGVIAVAMCVLAGLVALRRVLTVSPTSIFG